MAPPEGVIGAVALRLKVLVGVSADGIVVINAGEEALAWFRIVVSICLYKCGSSFLCVPDCILSASFVGKSFCLMKRNAMMRIGKTATKVRFGIFQGTMYSRSSPRNYRFARGRGQDNEGRAGK